jgi:hypothetical protein
MVMIERVVYEVDYGHDKIGQVRLINGVYRCFETPLFGGDWMDLGEVFTTEEEAIEFIENNY